MDEMGADIVAIFNEEAAERLDRSVDLVLKLEKEPGDRESLDALFREVHTLKGGAATIGLEDFAATAHAMEDRLAEVRDEKEGMSPALCDDLLAGLDALREALAARAGEAAGKADVRATASGSAPPPEPVTETAPRAAPVVEPTSPEAKGVKAATREAPDTIRARAEDLDRVLDLVGEQLVHEGHLEPQMESAADLARRLAVLRRQVSTEANGGAATDEAIDELDAVGRSLENLALSLRDQLDAGAPLLDELHTRALRMRMVPLESITRRLPRLVRDLSHAAGKEIEIEIKGEETQLDRTLLEQISEPLLHLLRNAVDHGIETPDERREQGKPPGGTIVFDAHQEGDEVIIEISDDGRGIDAARLAETPAAKQMGLGAAELRDPAQMVALLVRSGVSLAAEVTDVSGRGVGLDAVATAAKRVNGHLTLETAAGKGSTFRVALPLTVARVRGLVLRCNGSSYLMPAAAVESVERLEVGDIEWVANQPVTEVAGAQVPVVQLAGILGLIDAVTDSWEGTRPAVVIRAEGRSLCLLCSEVLDDREVVIKGLGSYVRAAPLCSGCTILADARVALILDPVQVAHAAAPALAATSSRPTEARSLEDQSPRVLVVEDSFTVRELQRSILSSVGYEVTTANDGQEALEAVKDGDVDLVVTDVEMPRMDGFAFIEAVRRDLKLDSLPIVVVSAKESDEDRQRGVECGADAYVTKSAYDQKTLLETVERLLAE